MTDDPAPHGAERSRTGVPDLLTRGCAALGLALPSGAPAAFARYVDLLIEWNRRAGLTTVAEPHAIVTRHFLDSIVWLSAVDVPAGALLIDVGAGAGFPGVPVKLARPDVRLTLLESARRKVAFLEHLCAELGIEAEVVWGRAEEVAHRSGYREAFDLAVARAVAPLRVLVELCVPFVRVGGRGVFIKGPRADAEVLEAAAAMEAVGGGPPEIHRRPVPEADTTQVIVVVPKQSTTPGRLPRRPGVPERRPL